MKRIGTHRITIFTGHFGSGKTELAMGEAVRSARAEETTIVDLDTVNVFLRTSEATERLNRSGVRVLSPRFAVSELDIPAITREMDGAFYQQRGRLIVDAGGDESGARVLGRYEKPLLQQGYDLMLVVNLNRPFTRDRFEIAAMAEAIEQACRLKITGIINNTHMMQETTLKDIRKGREEALAVQQMLGLKGPLYTASTKDLCPKEADPWWIPVEPMLKAPWQEEGENGS